MLLMLCIKDHGCKTIHGASESARLADGAEALMHTDACSPEQDNRKATPSRDQLTKVLED